MNVLSVSMTYPTAAWPARGVFVRQRLEAMARLMHVRVIAPRPWFPFGPPAPGGAVPGEWLPTRRPRMFCIPGTVKWADPCFYARVLCREMAALEPGFRPDLIDAHYVWPDGVAAARVARRRRVPYVVTIRGKIVSQSRYAPRRKQIRDMLRAADTRIAVSRSLADRAAALAGDNRPIHVIPNGVDSARFHPMDRPAVRRELGLDGAARYLVSVGYVQELKGFHQIVQVLPQVRRRCGDVRLLLVGDEVGEDGYVRRLGAAIASAGVTPFVTRIGGATPDQIARYLNAADLFVLASRSEGWCNAIHEALACGTPVVATDVGGNGELVCTADEGRLVPFGDAAALRNAIAAAFAAHWSRERISARAAGRTWRDVAHEVHAVFQEVLQRRCCRPS